MVLGVVVANRSGGHPSRIRAYGIRLRRSIACFAAASALFRSDSKIMPLSTGLLSLPSKTNQRQITPRWRGYFRARRSMSRWPRARSKSSARCAARPARMPMPATPPIRTRSSGCSGWSSAKSQSPISWSTTPAAARAAVKRDWGGIYASHIIAKQIIELVKAGERNPDVLCERALSYFLSSIVI